jgi:hypothetical protein
LSYSKGHISFHTLRIPVSHNYQTPCLASAVTRQDPLEPAHASIPQSLNSSALSSQAVNSSPIAIAYIPTATMGSLGTYFLDVVYSFTNCMVCFPSSPQLKINSRSFKILRLLGEVRTMLPVSDTQLTRRNRVVSPTYISSKTTRINNSSRSRRYDVPLAKKV